MATSHAPGTVAGRTYCGRKTTGKDVTVTDVRVLVDCRYCLAAQRADGLPEPAIPKKSRKKV